jgi:hypothetical protein
MTTIRLCARCQEVRPLVNNSYCRACRNAYVREKRRAKYGPRERRLAKERYREEPGIQIDRVLERRDTMIGYSKYYATQETCRFRRWAADPVAYYARVLVNSARNRAKKENVDFDLDREWVAEKLKAGVCEVTGMSLDLSPKQKGRAGQKPHAPSLDRKIPGSDYTKANVQIVVFIYNVSKSNWGHDLVKDMARFLTN